MIAAIAAAEKQLAELQAETAKTIEETNRIVAAQQAAREQAEAEAAAAQAQALTDFEAQWAAQQEAAIAETNTVRQEMAETAGESTYQVLDTAGSGDIVTVPVSTAPDEAVSQIVEEQQAAAQAAAEAYDVDIYKKSDGYYYYQDEDGNEIDIGTRKEDRASSMLDKYEEVVNENLTPLTDTSAYVDEDGEPKKGYRFGEDGTVFKDIGDTWAQVYVNKDGENVEKDTGREKFKNAEDWTVGAEGKRNEGLGGAINKFIDSGIAKGLLAIATGGLSVPYTTAATVMKGVSDGTLNAFQAFAGLGGFTTLTNNIIKELPNILGTNPSKELVKAIQTIGATAGDPKAVALSLTGVDEFLSKVGADVANEIGKEAGFSSTVTEGLGNTITGLIEGQNLDNAFGNAMTTFATESKEEIEKKIEAASTENTKYDDLSGDAFSEGQSGVGADTYTPTTPTTTPAPVVSDIPPELGESGADGVAPTITSEEDAPVIGDTPGLGTPADTDTSTPVIKTAEEELADLGLTDGAPPTRPDNLFGGALSEEAQSALTNVQNELNISDADKDIWIRTIIGEAAGETDEGQAAVAHTMLNRFKDGRFGDSLTDVLLADKQFSTWNDLDMGGNTLNQMSPADKEYQRAEALVDNILLNRVVDNTNGAVNYWNPDSANPDWGDEVLEQHADGGVKIDSHIFGGAAGGDYDEVETKLNDFYVSASGQEVLDDPTRFIGPTGAGIGPETTDENFQDQLAGILEGQGTGIDTTERDAEYQKKLDEFNKVVQETIGDPEASLGGALPENKGVRLLEDLPEQLRNLPIPGVLDPFGDSVTAQQVIDFVFKGEGSLGLNENEIFEIGLGLTKAKQDFLSGLIPNAADAVKAGYNYISDLVVPPAYGFGPATPLVFAGASSLQGAGTSAAIIAALATGAAVTSQIIDGVTQYFVDDSPVESATLQQALTDFESGTYDEIGPLITGTGFDSSGADEFAGMFTDATGSPYLEGTTIPYASQAAADGANIMAGTSPEVVDDLGIDLAGSGAGAGATLTDIIGEDASPTITGTPTLGTPATAGTAPIISTTADTPETTDETDQFATAGMGTSTSILDIEDQIINDTAELIDVINSGGGETIGQGDTDIGVGAGVGAGAIGAGTGTDVVTGTGTDIITGTQTGTQTGTETIADTTVGEPVIPTVLPPVVPSVSPPADPSVSPPEEEVKEEEEEDLTDQIQQTLYGQQVSVKSPELAEIDAPYDFSSIFGNLEQQNRFTGKTPYGTTEELLQLLGGKI